ncbi:MAG: Bax inhibitor-1 family protein, partial [Burkholderiales bacterium]
MQPEIMKTVSTTGFGSVSTNKVLRNTYMLLAISMIPTVFGAWLGMQINFSFFSGSPAIGFAAFLAIAFGFFWAIEKTKNSPLGVALLLALTFFMGLMLSRMIGYTLGSFSNGGTLIMTAFGGTAAVFAAMATLGSVIKKDLSGMGKFLFIGMILLLLAGFANIWLKIPALYIGFSLIAIGIFSAYM